MLVRSSCNNTTADSLAIKSITFLEPLAISLASSRVSPQSVINISLFFSDLESNFITSLAPILLKLPAR